MKRFKRLVSCIIWAIIALNVVLLGASRIPAAQQFLGRKTASLLSETLGTRVEVGRIDLGFLNRIIIDDLRVFDQQEHPLLDAARVSAKINVIDLAEGRVSISAAQLFGAHARLYRQSEGAPLNVQFIVDSLSSRDTTSHTPLDLRINSLIIRHSSVSYDQLDRPQTEGRLNPAHLNVSDISAHIRLRALTDDSLNINIRRLGFNEQSGLTVNRLVFQLEAGKQRAQLSDFHLQLPGTHLQVDTLTATYRMDEKGLIPHSLNFQGSIHSSVITPSDLRCLNSSLKNFQRPVNLTIQAAGTDQRIEIPTLQIYTQEKDVDLDLSGWLADWQTHPSWHLEMRQVRLSDANIDFLGKTIPQAPAVLTRIGGLQANGTFDRKTQGETALNGQIRADAGDMDVQLAVRADNTFNAHIKTDGLDLQQLTAHDQLGMLAAQVSAEGLLHEHQEPDVRLSGTVSRLDYNGYSYSGISLDVDYTRHTVSGSLDVADPALDVQLQGQLTGIGSEVPEKARKVVLQGRIDHCDLGMLHLSGPNGGTNLSATVDANFTASSINDAQGNLRISKLCVTGTDHPTPYNLDNLVVSSGYDEGLHFVSLKSDFADASLYGHFEYATLAQSVVNLMGAKLPTLPGLPPLGRKTDNNFSLRLMVSKTDWLRRFLNVDLRLQQPLMLNARINDRTQELFLDGDLPAFSYNGTRYADGTVHITTPGDTLNCLASISRLQDGGTSLNATLLAQAAHNNLSTSLSWENNNAERQSSGQLNNTIQFYRNLNDQPEAHVRVRPSHIILNNGNWEVEPSDIIYHKDHLIVDNFTVRRGQQHIIVDGIASRSKTDSLVADLQQVDVGYILDLVDFDAVEFSGKATGRAVASSLFDKFSASARLRVDDFLFERGRMGVLSAQVDWNQEKEQIDIQAVADDGPGVSTHIDGYVSPVHNTIDLGIRADSTYLDFMHNFTHSFLSQITGHADGNLRLAGTLDNINLTGRLLVDGQATVSSLNTTYTLRRDTVIFIPDEIELRRLPVYDRDGNLAFLSGGIHHRHLTHLTFDLYVDADNLLAYDFPSFGDDTFYGTVYATGTAAIHGRPGEVSIECDVTPQPNSVFVYNASSPDVISRQEFIDWTDSRPESTEPQQTPAHTRATDTDIYLNFLINARPEATLRLLMDANTSDYITLNGEGTIRATYHNKGAFNMFGTYTVDHGTYGVTIQNIIHKNFIFNPGGTITFGGDPYQAALNLQAVHTVSGVSLSDLSIGNSFSSNTIRVNCLMNISGQPAAPTIDFDLEMPTVNADEQQMIRSIINGQQEMNQQVVYLLGIGRFYNQGANNAAENQTGDPTSLAMQSLLSGTLSAQINNILNQFVKNDNWNFGANITTGNEGWHNAEYEGIVNGRMLNNRLLINGQFGYRDNATQATPSFIGDFDIQYLLYPNGNLALKVYNQTNDRYFTKSSLNTQGIGLIMKKDFNSLSDLFRSNRAGKKKNRKK